LPDDALPCGRAAEHHPGARRGIASDDLHLDPGADRASTEAALTSIPGIGRGRQLHRDARARRPGRLPAVRPRHPPRAKNAGLPDDRPAWTTCAAMVAVAFVRSSEIVED